MKTASSPYLLLSVHADTAPEDHRLRRVHIMVLTGLEWDVGGGWRWSYLSTKQAARTLYGGISSLIYIDFPN